MKSQIKSLPMVSGIMGAGLASVLCSSILTLSSLRTFSDLSPFSVSDLLSLLPLLPPFLKLGFLPFLVVSTSTQWLLCSLFPGSCFQKLVYIKFLALLHSSESWVTTNIGIALEFFPLSGFLDVLFTRQEGSGEKR